MKTPTDKKAYSERRLDKASKHVSALWFPINPETLATLRKNFKKKFYDRAPDDLLDDLKKDFALFTFVVKELIPIARAQKLDEKITQNPAELIRWAGATRIGPIIADDRLLPLSHIFNALEPFQAERLRETAIIASTAEVLSESRNLDPQTGFCHGVVREIGLNLIAWNYPTLYSNVIKNIPADSSLDEELARELGFSPSLLAIRVLQPPTRRKSSEINSQKIDDVWDSYEKLCQVGEALARAEHPDTYPSAENDWKKANDYLQKTVGDKAVTLIRDRAVEHSKEYQKTLTHLFESLAEFNPSKKIANHRVKPKTRTNRYLPQCTPEIQDALRALYAEMIDSTAARRVLETLLRTVIPKAGFTGGCVFLVDPAAMALVPRTVFGQVQMRDLARVGLRRKATESQAAVFNIDYHEIDVRDTDLAAAALSSNQPVTERPEDAQAPHVTGIYGCLGEERKVGVLYLEAPEADNTNTEQKTIGTFKAMRQALADALQLD
jgi:hypothetical protein